MGKHWAQHKEKIIELYNEMTLDQVMQRMATDFDFKASKRAYRFHFDQWNVSKYKCKKRDERRLQQWQRRRGSSSGTLSHRSLSGSSFTTQAPECADLDVAGKHNESMPNTTGIECDFKSPSLTLSTGLAFSNNAYAQSDSMMDFAKLGTGPVHESVLSLESLPVLGPEGSLGYIRDVYTTLYASGPKDTTTSSWLKSETQDTDHRDDGATMVTELPWATIFDAPTHEGYCPIHDAVRYGDCTLIKTLIGLGADVNVKGPHGWTPMHFVQTAEAVEYLMQSLNPPNLCAQDAFGDTPLHRLLGCHFWRTDIARCEAIWAILGHVNIDDDGPSPLNVLNGLGLTPLHMIVKGLDFSFSNDNGVATLRQLLTKSPDVTIPLPSGELSLCVVIRWVVALVRNQQESGQQKPNTNQNWKPALAVLQHFLETSPRHIYPATLLHELLSAESRAFFLANFWGFLETLVLHGIADVSSPDEEGMTALHHMLKGGPIVEDLAKVRGDVVGERELSVIRVLIESTDLAYLNHTDTDKMTALHLCLQLWSTHRNFWHITALLVARQADVSAFVDKNFTSVVHELAGLPGASFQEVLVGHHNPPLWFPVWLSACQQTEWQAVSEHLKVLSRVLFPGGLQATGPGDGLHGRDHFVMKIDASAYTIRHPPVHCKSHVEGAAKTLLERLLKLCQTKIRRIHASGTGWSEQYHSISRELKLLEQDYYGLLREARARECVSLDPSYIDFLTELLTWAE